MFREKLDRDSRQMQRMHDMMERLGVDPVDAARDRHGGALLAAIRSCCHCQSADACVNWLNDVRTEGERPSFCPNVDFFLAHRAATLPSE